MQENETIGERLRKALKVIGTSATEISRITGIPYPTLQDYLNNKRIPGGANLQKLAMLGISIDWLLTGKGKLFFENREGIKITKPISKEEEEMLMIENDQLIFILENHHRPWRVIPVGAIKKWKELFKENEEAEKFWKLIPTFLISTYSIIEFVLQGLFFYVKSYWEQITTAIWKFYWALKLKLPPSPADLAILGTLYFNKTDFVEAGLLLQSELKRKKISNWNFTKEQIKESLKEEKITFEPQDKIEPQTYSFLKQAGRQLIKLALLDKLPSFCLVHNKTFWTKCPKCSKLKNAI